MRRSVPAFITPLLLAISVACPLPAQSSAPLHRNDTAELAAFTFTMDNLTRLLQAGGAMDQLASGSSAVKKTFDRLNTLGNQTLSQRAALLASSPPLLAIARAHGFTARQFCVAEIAYLETALLAMAVKSGEPRQEILSTPSLNPANLAFFEQHRDEIKALQKQYTPDTTLPQ